MNVDMNKPFDSAAVERELIRILQEPEFQRSEVLGRFLKFVVSETLDGRASSLKSIVVAQAVFNRPPGDEGAENAVRTTAVRLRAALSAHYGRQSDTVDVIISIPKGGYVPRFEFRSARPETSSGTSGLGRLITGKFLTSCVAVLLVLGVGAAAWTFRLVHDAPSPVIYVQPVEANGVIGSNLARMIDYRLAAQLAGIGLTKVVYSGRPSEAATFDEWPLFLFSHLDDTGHELWLHLVDAAGVVVWSGFETLSSGKLNSTISAIAFNLLGENGAVPLLLEQRFGATLEGASCVTRAQLLLRVQRDHDFNQIVSCLEDHLALNPRDATAWASLSATLVVRTRYRAATFHEDYNTLIDRARSAANKAVEFAPTAYMTKVASMQLALATGDTGGFLWRQRQLRSDYPGDVYLHMRIASRLARFGDFEQALEIYDRAMAGGVDLSNRWPELALAHYLAGDHDAALDYICRSDVDQQYVLILKASIFGRNGMVEEAAKIVAQLTGQNPAIAAEFYPWHLGLGWSREVLDLLASDLSIAGLEVQSATVL